MGQKRSASTRSVEFREESGIIVLDDSSEDDYADSFPKKPAKMKVESAANASLSIPMEGEVGG